MGLAEAGAALSQEELRDAIDDPARRGEVPARALTEAFLRRIDAWQPRINAFITVTPELARQQADAADEARAAGRSLGPLHGVPVAVKDDIEVTGVPCTVGSSFLRDY